MKMNIKQIASLAQVSKSTVSKVLNNQGRVSADTRARILKLVDELDYQPAAMARALATQRTGIIGFFIPHRAAVSLGGSYWSMVLTGISERAGKLGYHVLVLNPTEECDTMSVLNEVLRRRLVDGLIIGSEMLDKTSFSTLVVKQMPFVLLGQHPDFKHYCVDDDNSQGMERMLDHLLGHGYRRIGALFGPLRYPYVNERHRAYQAFMAARGIAWTATACCEYSTELVAARLGAMLDAHPDMDALFVTSDGEFLMDALYELRRRRIAVPDFGLAVYDDYPFVTCLNPPVSAIQQPLLESGGCALDMLDKLINGHPVEPALVRLQNRLVPRESCGEAGGR
jgi:LacI family transcriptional regulator